MNASIGPSLRRLVNPILPAGLKDDRPVVPVVRLQGAIGIGTPMKPALTLSAVAGPLEKAFAVKGAKEIALVINSPGGSAAQAHLIYARIRQLAKEKDLGVAAFVEDAAASGGYMIACAADEIIADPASIVGSIGVVSAGFGFDRAIERLSIERRLYASGENKAILDPFSPEKAEDVERLKDIQREIHELFIALVKERRGKALSDDPELFTGAFWTGQTGVSLGLVDRVGDIRTTMRERWGEKVDLRVMTPKTSLLRRLMGKGEPSGVGASLAAGLAEETLAAIGARAYWARLGL
ncbi:S49 family peptidase [Hansschlegelia zhihuaiae]|uniref:S49 family peptidase n=1 Tax=Hansschlegelia zhihuaiae TaxID=405005 RepID=A0A4V1KHR2_9HYPH|nr:S49 family peptidase [Hansschlegelia zhihuaiae]RXF68082.1 S49 family peptidase [Hansschlegelia zhihuaiae]